MPPPPRHAGGPPSVRSWCEKRPGEGLELTVHRWAMRGGAAAGPLLLLHGFMDSGATWDMVAAELAAADYDVWAPDLRGFGHSDRVRGGGYYHFPDYLADVARLVDHLGGGPLSLVGHSMGGTVACLFAGTYPETVRRLVLLEGLGPPAMGPQVAVARMRRWLADLRKYRAVRPRDLVSEADALHRLALFHPRVKPAVLTSRLPLLTARSATGALHWTFDPMHRSTAPVGFRVEDFKAFLAQISCPVLFVSGGPAGWHPPDETERLAAITAAVQRCELPEAGHMMHWTAPHEVARLIGGFLGGAA